jgi:ribosome-associated protein
MLSNASRMNTLEFDLRGDHITLDALLKATGLVSSGGAAKGLIAEGAVRVDGQPEVRRGRKLRAGNLVTLGDTAVHLRAATPTEP